MDPLEERLDRMERKLDALLAALRTNGGGARVGAMGATGGAEGGIDPDIDGPRGDPEVRFVPKRWTGGDCKGMKFSACEPEFLDMLADAYEWFAQRDDETNAVDKNGSPKSRWSRLDASRARAWSARLRGDVGGAPAPARPARTAMSSVPRQNAPAPATNGRAMGSFGPAASTDDDIPF